MKKPNRKPDVQKATLYAIVVNGVQLATLIIFALCVTLGDLTDSSRGYLQAIALIGATLAGWGALIDIQDAVHTRRRVRTISELQTVNEQMDTLNFKLRAQRHDFLNHIQVVYNLLEMGESSEASNYLERVYTQLHSVSRVLRTSVTAFNALLQVKTAAAEEQGMQLALDIRSTLAGLAMPPWELCCVMGNLLDNAIDAAGHAEKPEVALKITESLRSYEFVIRNNGAVIPKELRAHIFEAGVSTKGDGHGMGLNIVRQRLNEYGGDITTDAGDEETAFTVTLPREAPANAAHGENEG